MCRLCDHACKHRCFVDTCECCVAIATCQKGAVSQTPSTPTNNATSKYLASFRGHISPSAWLRNKDEVGPDMFDYNDHSRHAVTRFDKLHRVFSSTANLSHMCCHNNMSKVCIICRAVGSGAVGAALASPLFP